jgi:hypothetical protein
MDNVQKHNICNRIYKTLKLVTTRKAYVLTDLHTSSNTVWHTRFSESLIDFTSRCLGSATNSGRSPSSGFRNCSGLSYSISRLTLSLSLILRPTVSRSSNKALICGLWPDFYYCQTCESLLMWGPLSDSCPYFTVSDSRLPFSSPPMTLRAAVEVFGTASTNGAENTYLYSCCFQLLP